MGNRYHVCNFIRLILGFDWGHSIRIMRIQMQPFVHFIDAVAAP